MGLSSKIFDTIIVGGGIAGLNAARLLSAAGCKIAVIEARDRLGGRILTLRKSEVEDPIELGAEFVHGLPHEVKELIAPERDLIEEKGDYLLAGSEGPRGVADTCFEELQAILQQLPQVGGKDCSFADFLTSLPARYNRDTLEMARSYRRLPRSRCAKKSVHRF